MVLSLNRLKRGLAYLRGARLKIALSHPWLYVRDIRRIYDAFDHDWYRTKYLANDSYRGPPIVHFLRYGVQKGYDPSPDFSTEMYLEQNRDVARAGMNPFKHYITHGRREGRSHYSDRYLAELLYQTAKTAHLAIEPQNDQIWLSIIVPTYDTLPRYLDDLVQSYRDQGLPGVELILSDDGSTNTDTISALSMYGAQAGITVVFNRENGGIAAATNAGIAKSQGRWVCFADHDDLLAPEALRQIYAALSASPNLQFLYTDELIVREDLEVDGLFFKPAYDPALLSGLNYINHLSVYRRDRIDAIGGLSTDLDGSQDHDLCLRYLDGLRDAEIAHLPYPAYWWRRSAVTFSQTHAKAAAERTRTLLRRRYDRSDHRVSVQAARSGSRVMFEPSDGNWPGVSVVIPNKEAEKLLKTTLQGLYEETDYPDFEVIVVDNGSTNKDVFQLYDDFIQRQENFQTIRFEEPFNFARSVNKGINAASHDIVLLLNNDIEVIEPGWLKEMVSCLAYPNVGIVGAKLLFPDRSIQHAGVIVGFGDLAGHWYLKGPEDIGANMNRLHFRNMMTCVTGAAMLITRHCLDEIGPWDETNFKVAYNDVDFCLRAYEAGIGTIWTPYATLVHHESATRGYEDSPVKQRRFAAEQAALRNLHKTENRIDPTSHPAYSRDRSIPVVAHTNYPLQARHRFGG